MRLPCRLVKLGGDHDPNSRRELLRATRGDNLKARSMVRQYVWNRIASWTFMPWFAEYCPFMPVVSFMARSRHFCFAAEKHKWRSGTSAIRLTGLALFLFFLRSQVTCNALDRRILGEFATLAIIAVVDTKPLREKVQFLQEYGCFPFGQQIDLQ